tara:strand:- start:384255 stop:384965 length:711 start_codon:yes stop_codon:yes gene_type:complete
MSKWKLLAENASIVLVGSFNPSIFHPEWFIKKGLVSSDWDYQKDPEGDLLITREVSQIPFPDEIVLTVQQNKFILGSHLASNFESLKDLVTSTFEILKETPVSLLGMNLVKNIEIPNDEDWFKFGSIIAPKDPWMKLLDYYDELSDIQKTRFGLSTQTMILPRPDNLDGDVKVKVEDLTNLSNKETYKTLKIDINNHIILGKDGITKVSDVLNDHWDNTYKFSDKLFNNLLDLNLN